MNQLLLHENMITMREEDGYINATELCKAGNRLFSTFYRRNKTKEFLKVLSNEVQKCTSSLIIFQTGKANEQATWVHPQVAINIAQWINPEFDVKVSKWIYELSLFGNVVLGKERTYAELEEELQKHKTQSEDMILKYTHLLQDYTNLKRTHRSIIKKKEFHYFKRGKCFYIISNILENVNRIKLGMSVDINSRLSNHRTTIPFLKIHYLVFLDENELLEKIIKKHYEKELTPNNHEFISSVSIESIIKKTRECIQLINCGYTEISNEELLKYNCVDENNISEQLIQNKKEKEIDDKIIRKSTEEILNYDVPFLKRCPGKHHTNEEEERQILSSNFHKNRSTVDGYATYCKKCSTRERTTNDSYLEKMSIEYDKNIYKWCPGSIHLTNKDRIVLKTNFHSNKASKDGLTGYCKECTAEMKYGKDRKSHITYPKCPGDFDKDSSKWCTLCQKILSRKDFHNSNTSADGLQNACKECRKRNRNQVILS